MKIPFCAFLYRNNSFGLQAGVWGSTLNKQFRVLVWGCFVAFKKNMIDDDKIVKMSFEPEVQIANGMCDKHSSYIGNCFDAQLAYDFGKRSHFSDLTEDGHVEFGLRATQKNHAFVRNNV